MQATVIDKHGKTHIFRYPCSDGAEAFGALMQWYAEIWRSDNSNIVSLDVNPDTVILPFMGKTSLKKLLLDTSINNPLKF